MSKLKEERVKVITFKGNAAEIGAKYGKLLKDKIKRRLSFFLYQQKNAGISEKGLLKKSHRYKEILRDVAPYWLEEMEAVADAACVRKDIYVAFNAFRYLPLSECTSFLAVGKASKNGQSILHKNEDLGTSGILLQHVLVKQMTGTYKYIAAGDVGCLGIRNFFINEKGLAGGRDAGPTCLPEDRSNMEMSPPDISRLIAEKAENCEEALEILQNMVKKRFYAAGNIGSIWLFVDKEKGLVVENSLNHLGYKWVKDSIAVRANRFLLPGMRKYRDKKAESNRKSNTNRYRIAIEYLSKREGRIDCWTMNEISRSSKGYPVSVCNDGTVSGITCVIDKEYPQTLSYASIALGHALNTYYLPFYIGMEGAPEFMVNGEMWRISHFLFDESEDRTLPHPFINYKEIEVEVEQKRKRLEKKIKILVKKGKEEQAKSELRKVNKIILTNAYLLEKDAF